MSALYRCSTIERNGFEIELRILNECIAKHPRMTFVEQYNIDYNIKKLRKDKSYYEVIGCGTQPILNGGLKNGIKKGEHTRYDPHRDEVVDMVTGLVVSSRVKIRGR